MTALTQSVTDSVPGLVPAAEKGAQAPVTRHRLGTPCAPALGRGSSWCCPHRAGRKPVPARWQLRVTATQLWV